MVADIAREEKGAGGEEEDVRTGWSLKPRTVAHILDCGDFLNGPPGVQKIVCLSDYY